MILNTDLPKERNILKRAIRLLTPISTQATLITFIIKIIESKLIDFMISKILIMSKQFLKLRPSL
jgi:hypothetical protein